MATKLVGLNYDHPEFVSRLTLTMETCLQFFAAGAGHGILSVACTDLERLQYWEAVANYAPSYVSQTLMTDLFINGRAALKSFSSRTSRDYKIHYGNNPSSSRLLLLELLRLSGFLFSKWLFLPRNGILTSSLSCIIHKPSVLLSFVYVSLVLWMLSRILPELTVISSYSLTIPKLVARCTGAIAQVRIKIQKDKLGRRPVRMLAFMDLFSLYQYSAVLTPPQIRLLRVDCTNGTAKFSFLTVKLDEAPDFWAVSYLWGSDSKPAVLEVVTTGSGPTSKIIQITVNCAAAILALTPTKDVRFLWIDAICINQADDREKALQVPLMGQIYSQASLVVGHIHTKSELSFGLLVHRMIQTFANGKKYDFNSGGSFLIYRALSELLQHQYFQRAWILQEIVLAKSMVLIHGNDCIDFDHLLMISDAFSKNRVLPMRLDDTYFQKWSTGMPKGTKMQEWMQFSMSVCAFKERATVIEKLRRSIREGDTSHRLTVAEIVDHNMMLGAGNPRDQVYALLSLASDSSVPQLQPEYSFAISNKEIFTRISWYYLQKGHRLNLFLSAGLGCRLNQYDHENPRTPGLPSWVFDFSFGPAREFLLGNWAADIERARPVRLTCSLSPEYLSVRGLVVDKVAFIATQPLKAGDITSYSAASQNFMLKAIVSVLDETLALVQSSVPDPYPDQTKREEAYWRTMIMDRYCGNTPASTEGKEMFERICKYTRTMHTNPSSQPLDLSTLDGGAMEQRLRSGIDSVTENITKVWVPYTFVVLESGHMGWAPHGVQVGDVFCLFDGCIVPFVLRPLADNNTFSLWGDGYVHGFMPGQKLGSGERLKEWFNLV